MQWTERQEQAIRTRNCNLLVSAAAGSGKTAVLVERIIRMVSEGPKPLDIDRLLVMTFTNAAAAEMRERVALAIEKKLSEQPDNEHLQAQAALVPYAQITTIDSFCLSLIRDHFNLLAIDPSFRIGDEGELKLLRADVMQDMLEAYYGAGDPSFEKFVDTYATGKSDSGIEDYIMQVYTFAQSNPFPEQWFARCRMEIEQAESGSLRKTPWMRFLMADVKRQLDDMAEQYADAVEVCRDPDGPEAYLPTMLEELQMIRNLSEAGTYDDLCEGLRGAEFGRLKAARGDGIDPLKKERVSECRKRIKKAVGDLKTAYGVQKEKEAAADLLAAKDVVLKLLELAETFAVRYQEAKKDRNLADFNDLEHYALQILVEKPDETAAGSEEPVLRYTETADRLSRQYAEILVDEYQDSNYVQETLIQALSGERFGRPDVFLVGDVKQSIYKFRLARPELFMEKYETYKEGTGSNRKIELYRNFRSRETVLQSVNYIFYQIMTKDLGNVDYTGEAALHPGAVFAPGERCGTPTELLLLDTGKESMGALSEEAADYTARELEAKMIAERMRQLTDPRTGLQIWDNEKKSYRPAGYGDMVILLRSMAGWSETILQVLTREGIPAYAETGSGYFDAIEVETVLAMLAVIDNPMQDIPLAAVLRSPIAGLTDEEMAWMMAAYKKEAGHRQDRGIYGAFRYLAGGGRSGCDMPKLRRFSELLKDLRGMAPYLPIHELIGQVYERTGYYDYVSAMPAGQTRRANLDMLIEKASAFEKTSYKGLFQFIRYITQLRKYESDFGEASAGQYENMARVMSIHKSKGLEFPVVFLAGMGKQFNKQDTRGRLIIDPELGIATDYLDLGLRVKSPTLKKNVVKRKMELDNLGEEMRVLYVGMTRAKEKLIMTGADRSLAKKLAKWGNAQVSFTVLSAAVSYLDWLLMAHPEDSGCIEVRQIPVETLAGEEVLRQIMKRGGKEELLRLAGIADPAAAASSGEREGCPGKTEGCAAERKAVRGAGPESSGVEGSGSEVSGAEAGGTGASEAEGGGAEAGGAGAGGTGASEAEAGGVEGRICGSRIRRQLDLCFSFRYPHEADVSLHTKMTVSELKKQGQELDDYSGLIQAAPAGYLTEREPGEGSSGLTVPGRSGMAADGIFSYGPDGSVAMEDAARRGTAYHRVLELLDFTRTESCSDIEKQVREMKERHRIGEAAAESVYLQAIWRFAASPFGKRMRSAQESGRLYREQQFILGLPAREMGLADSDELVLIQGIIDVYLEEDDGLVLLDYKTDRVPEGRGDLLAERYKVQLDYYRRALEQMTGKCVKERFIYSLHLSELIAV